MAFTPNVGRPDLKQSQAIVDYLNHLVSVDSDAINALVGTRVKCNEALANHPTVQAITDSDGSPTVGFVGLLNGFVGVWQGSGYGGIYFCRNGKQLTFKVMQDTEWNQKKAVWNACRDAGIDVPDEVQEFFDYRDPSDMVE